MEEILAMKKIPVSNTFNLAHSMLYFGHMWPWFPLFDYINLGWVLNPRILKENLSN